MSDKRARFFLYRLRQSWNAQYADTIAFYYPPLIFLVPMDLAMILRSTSDRWCAGARYAFPLIVLFLPPSLSCALSFRSVTWVASCAGSPRVYLWRAALYHTQQHNCQLYSQHTPASLPLAMFLWWCDPPPPLLLMLRSPQLLPRRRRWGELLMACSVHTAVPAAAGHTPSTPSNRHIKLDKTNRATQKSFTN